MTILKQHPKALNHLFEDFFNNYPQTWGRDTQTANVNMPPVNIFETNDGYQIDVNAPGRNKEDFKVEVENNLLTISFEKKTEPEQKEWKTIRQEFSSKSFKRSFTLDDKVNADGIQAKYENGVLQLFIPKKEEVKVAPKEITIL